MSLHEAAKIGDIATLQRLMSRGHKIDARDRGGSGNTPLLYAVSRNQNDAACLLILAGADVNIRTGLGDGIVSAGSALHVAAAGGNLGLTKLLLDAGADLNSRIDGVSPFGAAVDYDRWTVARFLLQAGATTSAGERHAVAVLNMKEQANSTEFRSCMKQIATSIQGEFENEECLRIDIDTDGMLTKDYEDRDEFLPGIAVFRLSFMSIPNESSRSWWRRITGYTGFLEPSAQERAELKTQFQLGDRARQLVDQQYVASYSAGYLLICSSNLSRLDRASLYLFPTLNPYAVIRTFGTYEPSLMNTEELIGWLREINHRHPYRLRGCGQRWLELEFADRPDTESLIRLYDDVYSMVDEWCDSQDEFLSHFDAGKRLALKFP